MGDFLLLLNFAYLMKDLMFVFFSRKQKKITQVM